MLPGKDMRLLRAIFIVAVLSGVLWAEDINPPFAPGITITFAPPDPKVWKLAEREEQEAIGFVLYKRAAIVDENGLSVEPCLSIVYRKVPEDVTDPMAFVVASRSRIPYEITGMSLINDGLGMVISFKHLVAGSEHMSSIAHYFKIGLGVQAISESTTTVFKDIEADQAAFFQSVSLNKK
jgi:hypothetical protein